MLIKTESVCPHAQGAPVVTEMLVVPVAGEDSMLLNLSGAHAPFFTRNIVMLTDNSGHVGVGEVFVIAGQSNSGNHGSEKQKITTGMVAACSQLMLLAGTSEMRPQSATAYSA